MGLTSRASGKRYCAKTPSSPVPPSKTTTRTSLTPTFCSETVTGYAIACSRMIFRSAVRACIVHSNLTVDVSSMRAIRSWKGSFVGWIDNDGLFARDGRHVGQIYRGVVYAENGHYLG